MPSRSTEHGEVRTPEEVDSLLQTAPASPSAAQRNLHATLQEVLAENRRLHDELTLRDRALDAVPSHFVISKHIDAHETIIIYANRAIAQSHGYTREELLGRNVSIIAPADWSIERHKQIRAQLEQGKEVRAEGEVLRRDGTAFWIGITIVPIMDSEGRLTHSMGMASDITVRLEEERKKRELQDRLYKEMQERERMLIELRLAQKLEAVGRLAAGMAHEINTPIQYVGDSLHFLRSACGDVSKLSAAYHEALKALRALDPEHSVLDEIKRLEAAVDLEFLEAEMPKAFARTFEGVDRVTHIVRAMKEFSHPDAAEFSAADINHALQTTLTVATNEYKYCAAVRTRFDELPPVLCNIGELNQVFLNLIVNAAHAIQDAGKDAATGEITVSTALKSNAVEITIADNGCGIPQDNLEKIYDPFFTTKEVGRGTGQGLAIARSIVIDKHGGNIRVQTAPGAGTQFILTLPVEGHSR